MRCRRRAGTSLILASALLSIPALYGQSAPAAPTPAQMATRQVATLTTLLSLTSAQQEAATALFTSEETTLQTIRTNLRDSQSTLETAVEANDSATISSTASQIGTLTAQEVTTRAQARAAFFASLTTDQQTKYKQLVQTGILDGRGGPGGPGGMGGPDPGGPGHRGPGPQL